MSSYHSAAAPPTARNPTRGFVGRPASPSWFVLGETVAGTAELFYAVVLGEVVFGAEKLDVLGFE